MPRVQGGRACPDCNLRVHDLTRKTRAEALAVALLFGGDGRRVCGRLRVDEHGDAVFREPVPARRPPAIAAAAIAVATGCGAASSPAETEKAVCVPTATIMIAPAPAVAALPSSDSEPRGAIAAKRDSDGDGVVDDSDACPDQAASSANGCPPQRVIVTTAGDMAILERVTFASNSKVIQRQSLAILDATAGVLQSHPEITHVVVEGHTDVSEKNVDKLSLDRAREVVDYLVKKGVKTAVLEPRGAGAQKPIETNATLQGRTKNRRVEFRIDTP